MTAPQTGVDVPDLTSDQILFLAKVADINIPPEDVRELTLRMNSMLEVLPALFDSLPLNGVQGLPALAHPIELPHAK
jgi:hypothetical protein